MKVNDSNPYFLKKIAPALICVLLFLVLPALLPGYLQSMFTKVLIFALFALSLNLIWNAHMISLGHAAYFGLACYVTAILSTQHNISNFWILLVLSIAAAIILAMIFGIIALRMSGIYFLMVTLALGQLVFFSSLALRSITSGMNGLFGVPWPELSVISIEWQKISFYYFTLLIFIVCAYLLYRVSISPFGYALRGIAEDEPKMKTLGINTWLIKYGAYIISAAFAAVAGVLFTFFSGLASPLQLSIETSTLAVLMLIIGSSSVFWGPVTGAFLVILLEYFSSVYIAERWPMVLGIVFVCSVMFLRDGISVHIIDLWRKWILREEKIACE